MRTSLSALVLTFVLVFLICQSVQAQATIQDCLGAVPVCQTVYSESESPVGTGSITEIPTGVTCTDGELNSIWYVFTTSVTGELGFVITPNNANDDYDWALFNLTNATCDDILTNPFSLIVSCNAAGGSGCHGPTGATGASNNNNQPGGCGIGNTPFNDLVPMQAGQTFVLMVSNWTGSPNGYTLDFGLSSGVDFIDTTDPLIDEIITPQSCGEDRIELVFSEFMQCSSMESAAFSLTGPGGPYNVIVEGADCENGASQSTEFMVKFSPPISARGSYNLSIDPTSSLQLLDLCGNQLPNYSWDFEVDVPIDVDINLGADTSLVCQGDVLILDASQLGFAYQWTDGSTDAQLEVTDAGVYGVTVENVCGFGEDELEVIVQQFPPTVDLGVDQINCEGDIVTLDVSNDLSTYSWSDGNTNPIRDIDTDGLYMVSVTNSCGTTIDEVMLDFIPPLNPDFGQRVLCFGETALLDFTHPFASYQWSDGNTAAIRSFTDDISLSLTISTDCETMTGDVSVVFLRDPSLELGPDTLLCPGDVLLLDPGIPGGDYQWQDGSTDPSFTVTQPGTYELRLTTACNELTDRRVIDYVPTIEVDLGRDTFLCEDAGLLFNVQAQEYVNYRWEDGSTEPIRRITGPGNYLLAASSPCETVLDTLNATLCEVCDVYVPNVFSPNGDGVNDNFQYFSDCELTEVSFLVFDRWGSQVFVGEDGEVWRGDARGRDLKPGVYIWSLEYTVVEDGIAKRRSKSGDITLLR